MKGEQINSKTLIVMGGPTASGKTDLAIKVAQNFNGEIINADSMQVYQDMDIGTNKGHVHPLRSIWNDSQIKPIKDKIEDREFVLKPYEINNSGVIGWLFNIVKPDYNFTVSEYQKLAYTIIDSIHQRGKVPVLVGGTGLYIDAVIKGYRIHSRPDLKLREKLNTLTVIELQEEIKKLDYNLEKLNNSDRNNPRRLIRLAEKLFADRNGKNKKNTNKVEKGFNVIFLYPDIEKEEIFSNIEKRAEQMLERGLVKEVKKLFAQGYSPENKTLQSTGYKQVSQYLTGVGEIATEEELVKEIIKAHKNYAKRQITWFEGKGRNYKLIKVNQENVLSKLQNI